MDGILIVDKPKGVTSHDIVDFIRKRFHLKKVGHAGTLDPAATGVLVILLGNSTKQFSDFSSHDKEYQGCLTLGTATDSLDGDGRVTEKKELIGLSLEQVEAVFRKFLGSIEQIPPMFSALKHQGKRLYQLARQGLEVERRVRQVHIYKLKIAKFLPPQIYFVVKCSKGTYIRSLCQDIAGGLGYPGHLSELRRVISGPFTIEQALTFSELQQFSYQSLQERTIA
ncbi:MAG: tRNA pseudouridine(55) synthase TruB [Candidatus Omnitrophica bacterium]|nr:tRNA pseudouridine(55) synthase TruB [Candidatus Omnitrophota bacterium]